MVTDSELNTLERRAQNAINGYTADVNITCYVYGQDVLTLLKEIKGLKKRLLDVADEFRPCVSNNGRIGPEFQQSFTSLGAVSVKQCCKLLGIVEESH